MLKDKIKKKSIRNNKKKTQNQLTKPLTRFMRLDNLMLNK